jgi:hypothetical protein
MKGLFDIPLTHCINVVSYVVSLIFSRSHCRKDASVLDAQLMLFLHVLETSDIVLAESLSIITERQPQETHQ